MSARVLFLLLICGLSRQPHVFTCVIIAYEDDFMKNEIYIAFNPEILMNTQFKITFTNYTKSDISTKGSALLPVDWDKNGLLFTKRLHIMNKIICHSYVRTLMNSL